MTFEVRGRRALVTGGAKRIGRATALALAGAGADVVVHYRASEGEAAEAVGEIERRGGRAWRLDADLADPAAAASLFARAEALAGPVDIVINSASIFPADTLVTTTVEALAANMQINAFAPFLLGRALATTGREGAIINFLDTRIVHNDAAHAAYHLSKRALFTFTRMMALTFAPRLPPPGEDDSFLRRMAGENPLGRHGDLAGVVDAVMFLLRSDFVTGQTIFVDGGFHLKGSVYGSL
jgi:NAD(P)-dependent dehydrogenase (short-subunit alcohol dehydrogenase family)